VCFILIIKTNKNRREKTMKNKKLKETFKEYQEYYLKEMGWNMEENFNQWLERMKDTDSFLIKQTKTER
jgi:hypothetical protein